MKKYLYFLFFGWILFCLETHAQPTHRNPLIDPLKQPKTWIKIRNTPLDSALWSQYFQKDWKDFTTEDKQTYDKCKHFLMVRWLADHDPVGLYNLETVTRLGLILNDSLFRSWQSHMPANRYAVKIPKKIEHDTIIVYHPDTVHLRELFSTLRDDSLSFKKIENYFQKVFKYHNIEYQFYIEKYPQQRLNKTAWIDRQETRLKRLKEKIYEQLYESYLNQREYSED